MQPRDPGPRFTPASPAPVLNNVTTTDAYSAANTLFAPRSKVVIIQVNNNAIFHQFGIGPSIDAIQWLPEEFDGVANYVFDDQTIDAVRIRSAAAGNAGQVTVRVR